MTSKPLSRDVGRRRKNKDVTQSQLRRDIWYHYFSRFHCIIRFFLLQVWRSIFCKTFTWARAKILEKLKLYIWVKNTSKFECISLLCAVGCLFHQPGINILRNVTNYCLVCSVHTLENLQVSWFLSWPVVACLTPLQ